MRVSEHGTAEGKAFLQKQRTFSSFSQVSVILKLLIKCLTFPISRPEESLTVGLAHFVVGMAKIGMAIEAESVLSPRTVNE